MAKRTVTKIPSDILRRVGLKGVLQKVIVAWIAIEANPGGVVELSHSNLAHTFGVRKFKVREALEVLAEKNIIIFSDEYNSDHGGYVWWPEGTCWSLYYGATTEAQWCYVERAFMSSPCTFTGFTFSQVLERQGVVFTPLKVTSTSTTTTKKKGNASNYPAPAGRKLSSKKPAPRVPSDDGRYPE